MLVCGVATAGISDGVVRIAVITDLNGIYADWGGQGIVIAAEMAVEDAGGEVAGSPVKVVVGDDRLEADHAIEVATQFNDATHVDMITGSTGSNVAIPLQQWAGKHGIVTLTSGAASTDLTNRACTPTGIHWTYDTWALTSGSVPLIMENGGNKWFFVTADYAFGHILEQQTAAAVERQGGAVLGNALAPYQGDSFVGELQQAKESGANVIAFANAGKDTQRTIREGYELGMPAPGHQWVALLTFLTDIKSLGLYVTSGLKFTTGFYWNLDERTRAWSERFYRRVGAMPTMAQAGTYSAVKHYLEAVAATGSDDGVTVVKRMKATPVHDFFAHNGYIREDGRMVHEMYVAEVKDPRDATRAWDYLKIIRRIPGDQAFRPLNMSECPLVQ